MSALEATAALAGIATVAGASSKQFIGGAVPRDDPRRGRSYYGPWSAKGLNLPAWSVTPGARPGIAAARFAPTPRRGGSPAERRVS